MVPIKDSVYICGCVCNCAPYLPDVLSNIRKIVTLFQKVHIIFACASTRQQDNSEQILQEFAKSLATTTTSTIANVTILKDDHDTTTDTTRLHRLKRARNAILEYIRAPNMPVYEYMIMMDMDDVCARPIQLSVLQQYLSSSSSSSSNNWDALSFAHSGTYYYDLFALSIAPFILPCCGWQGKTTTMKTIDTSNFFLLLLNAFIHQRIKTTKTITTGTNSDSEEPLIPCLSAFHGFAIYRMNAFTDCWYDIDLDTNIAMFPKDVIENNKQVLIEQWNMRLSGVVDTQSQLLSIERKEDEQQYRYDCEHKHFHFSAILKHNAAIRISPKALFM